MWIITTILDGGDIEEAIMKAIVMKAKRPSHFPPQGFLLAMLTRIEKAAAAHEVSGTIDIRAVESSRTS